MNETTRFRALVVREVNGSFQRAVEERSIADLPAGEVLIRVHFSSLNYKDALAASGNRGVTKKYPHTPGIDAAGVVVASSQDQYKVGDEVLCMGYDLGMNTSGGFAEYIRVPAAWVLPKPSQLSFEATMQVGTAGFTAAQCVDRLLALGVQPSHGPVLVTGATGGVGSLAVLLLAHCGFQVTAVTGKDKAHDLLRGLGCTDILSRKQAIGRASAALLRERWAGVVDTVGGELLAAALKSTQYNGVVTCCGNAASPDLALTVYPFILRGVSLVGIDSAVSSLARRKEVWEQLAGPWRQAVLEGLAKISQRVCLEGLSDQIDAMLQGQTTGRIVVDLEARP